MPEKKMTREEVEDFIHKKIVEIRDVCMKYDPRCHHVSMYYIGRSINCVCIDEKTGETLLDKHNNLFVSDEEGEKQ